MSSEQLVQAQCTPPAAVIVLAAGDGKRMQSKKLKVLHEVGGRPMLWHVLAAARHTGAEQVAVVVRARREQVTAWLSEHAGDVVVADQDDIPGTGRAAECGLMALSGELAGSVVIVAGDVPLVEGSMLTDLVAAHQQAGAAVTILTTHRDDPTGYGRVVTDGGIVREIVEQRDAETLGRADVLAVTEVNTGIGVYDASVLRDILPALSRDNAQGEKYLTDVVAVARERGLVVRAHAAADGDALEGVNNRAQLAERAATFRRRAVARLMADGVTVMDPATTWVDAEVTVGRDTVIWPNTYLLGATTVGEDCVIGPDVTLTSCEVRDGAHVTRAVADLAVIGAAATVGPYSYLRPGTELGAKGKIGGFVETKNAKIGDGAKVPHLTYCGDAVIGEGANIGAGTIFANYDGVAKHPSHIGRHAFVGSNSVLVAPAQVGDGAYVAAGSALTQPVGPGEIAIARGRQVNKPGWVERHRAGTASAEAAVAAQGDAEPGIRHTEAEPTSTTDPQGAPQA